MLGGLRELGLWWWDMVYGRVLGGCWGGGGGCGLCGVC